MRSSGLHYVQGVMPFHPVEKRDPVINRMTKKEQRLDSCFPRNGNAFVIERKIGI
jgi:hypothetical protein